MQNKTPLDYKFCPFCSNRLNIIKEEKKKIKFCRQCSWKYYPHVANSVTAIIIKNNEILMVKRNKEPYKGTWMFPAGFVSYGESPEESLKREIKEETGLDIENMELKEIYQAEDDSRAPGHFVIIYKVKTKPGKIKNNDKNENQEVSWQKINNPPKIGFKTHKIIMKKIQDDKF
jgi:8-oxo-dGTP diphosphatase